MRVTRKSRCARQFAGDFLIGLVVFLFVLALATLDPTSARSAPVFHVKASSMTTPGGMTPATVTRGTLFHAPAKAADDAGLVKTEAIRTAVDITAYGTVVRTRVRQVFPAMGTNRESAIYAFPMPDDATINSLLVDTGSQAIRGEIVTRSQAARMLKGARDAGRKLGEEAGDAHMLIVEIPALELSAPVTIGFAYEQALRPEDGRYRIRFPLREPRANGAPLVSPVTARPVSHEGDDKADSTTNPAVQTNDVSIRVHLDTGFALGAIESPTHEIVVRRTDAASAFVHLARTAARQDNDFDLSWNASQAGKEIAVFEEPLNKNSYVMALIRPLAGAGDDALLPREVVFAVDTSGSMAGTSFDQMKQALVGAIERLTPRDRFNVIQFNSKPNQVFSTPEAATRESVAVAKDFISGLEAAGGTEALPALDAALKDKLQDSAKRHDKRLRQVVFITDGEIPDGAAFLTRIAEVRGRSRLFTVSIGETVSEAVMERAAEVGRGAYLAIRDRSKVAKGLASLFERIERPAVTDLQIEWPKGVRADAWPNPLPDLYRGETLVVSAKLSGVKGELKVAGKLAGRNWRRSYALGTMKPANGLDRFWAKQKIASLNARVSAGQSRRDVNAAIEAIALEHDLVSERSVLVGIDLSPPESTGTLASEELATELPAAWVKDGIERNYMQLRDAGTGVLAGRNEDDSQVTTSSLKGSQSSGSGPSAARIAMRTSGVGTYSNGRGPADQQTLDQTWMLTVMAIVFGLMTALTLGLWRHLRHAVEPRRRSRRSN